MLLQCPQETRAPAGWGSGLAGPGWTGPRFIILLLEGDRQTDTASQHSPVLDIIQCKSMLITPDVASGSFFFFFMESVGSESSHYHVHCFPTISFLRHRERLRIKDQTAAQEIRLSLVSMSGLNAKQ